MGFEEELRSVALPLLRFSVFASHAVLFGLVPILLLVVRPAFAGLGPEWDAGRRRLAERFEGLVTAALLGSIVATGLVLLLQSALVSELGTGEISEDSFLSVLETSFGQAVALRVPLLVGLAVILVGRVRNWSLQPAGAGAPSPLWWIAWAGFALGLFATSTYSGHATVADPRDLALANDLVHQLSSAIWFTGVVLLAVLLPDGWLGRDKVDRLELLSPAVSRFSRVAFISIAIVAVTGTANSLLHVEALDDLWDSGYGRAVGTKIVLFLGILALGGFNHYRVRRRLEDARVERTTTEAQGLFRRAIAAELAIALSVMATTGLLVGLSRTRQQDTPVPIEEPASQSERATEG